MSATLPIHDDVLGALDGAVRWLQYVSDAIDDGRLVIAPDLRTKGIDDTRSQIKVLQGMALPGLRGIAARSREYAKRAITACR